MWRICAAEDKDADADVYVRDDDECVGGAAVLRIAWSQLLMMLMRTEMRRGAIAAPDHKE